MLSSVYRACLRACAMTAIVGACSLAATPAQAQSEGELRIASHTSNIPGGLGFDWWGTGYTTLLDTAEIERYTQGSWVPASGVTVTFSVEDIPSDAEVWFDPDNPTQISFTEMTDPGGVAFVPWVVAKGEPGGTVTLVAAVAGPPPDKKPSPAIPHPASPHIYAYWPKHGSGNNSSPVHFFIDAERGTDVANEYWRWYFYVMWNGEVQGSDREYVAPPVHQKVKLNPWDFFKALDVHQGYIAYAHVQRKATPQSGWDTVASNDYGSGAPYPCWFGVQ